MHPTDTESDRLDDDVVEELMSSGREVVLGFASLEAAATMTIAAAPYANLTDYCSSAARSATASGAPASGAVPNGGAGSGTVWAG